MAKGLIDTKQFVLTQLQQKLASLSQELAKQEDHVKQLRGLAIDFQRHADSKLRYAAEADSRAEEIKAEINSFREELSRQRTM